MTEDFTVRLDRVFSGPMDLLLHLVREQEVEIHEIEIHAIVRDYLQYLKHLSEVDIEAAGDFVLMAATLMAIKSRSLLPKEELDLAEELDPKDELIQRLLEFRRFRGAAEDLEARLLERSRLVERAWHGEIEATRDEPMLDLGDLTSWDLLAHWSRLQREIMAQRPRHIRGDARPLRFWVHQLADVLKKKRAISLRAMVEAEAADGAPAREALIGSFCAVLELAKLGIVRVDQEDQRADIQITLATSSPEEVDEILSSATIEELDDEKVREIEEELDRLEDVERDEGAPTFDLADAAEGALEDPDGIERPVDGGFDGELGDEHSRSIEDE
ncbi:MAG: segregation/condensation protein A [Planctomycetota bacterium]